ncbi:Gfo/Idh/MocA family protein [Aestuariivirga litoralis]|uniref:Gfo/Idh/MocA family protein n=1 Tax=Aestuariivirga litoralis TaxID=2650924 RepID=UPI0018C5F56F|nr:Gfo/Idh/MocA family oxidoreductase [Aestuariivirga litoralis]MBG1231992.1 Gfo/Idh/MocA family oxidoreductase [Aestuariivirga litoralis]
MSHKIAVVGLGKIATDQHVPCISKNKKFDLVATVSRNNALAGKPHFSTIGELIKSKVKVDCVALCTPPSVRLAIAREALDAGYHVLIEKPPTPTVGEMLAMIEYAKKKKRVLYATWHSRYNDALDLAKKRLKGKTVNFMRVNWREDVNKWHPGQEWIAQPGGFGVFDPGINALSAVTKILPEPVFVEASKIEVPENWSTPIGVEISFKRGDGKPADMQAVFDWRQRGEQTWEIEIGTTDGMKMKLTHGGSVLYINGKLIIEAKLEEYERIYAKFAKLLKAKKSDTDTAPLQLICDAYMMAKPVVVKKFVWDAGIGKH